MKYPYIGKLIGEDSGIVLFTGDAFGCILSCSPVQWIKEKMFKFTDNWDESEFTNITGDFLKGKCVKIESPEQGAFIDDLATTNGIPSETKYGHVFFNKDALKSYEVTTIPLPPGTYRVDKMWPQVGDEIVLSKKVHISELRIFSGKKCEVIGICKNRGDTVLTVRGASGEGITAFNMGDWVERPKTKVEKLCDIFAHDFDTIFQESRKLVPSSTLNSEDLEYYATAMLKKGWVKPK